MLNSLKKLFQKSETDSTDQINDLFLLCGLMMEAAYVDGNLEKNEIEAISKILIEKFNEESSSVTAEIDKCLSELNDNKSLHFFTSRINKSFSSEKKFQLIEVLWEIILIDDTVHDFESNLIRRLAGLLYISDFQCGLAKKNVLEKKRNSD